MTDDDVAGGPAQSPANEADRTSGGVEVDTQDRTEPLAADRGHDRDKQRLLAEGAL